MAAAATTTIPHHQGVSHNPTQPDCIPLRYCALTLMTGRYALRSMHGAIWRGWPSVLCTWRTLRYSQWLSFTAQCGSTYIPTVATPACILIEWTTCCSVFACHRRVHEDTRMDCLVTLVWSTLLHTFQMILVVAGWLTQTLKTDREGDQNKHRTRSVGGSSQCDLDDLAITEEHSAHSLRYCAEWASGLAFHIPDLLFSQI